MALRYRIETDDATSVHSAMSDDDMSTCIHNGTIILHSPIQNMTVMTNAQRRVATQSVNNNAVDFIKAVLSNAKSPLQNSLSLEMYNYILLYFEQKKFKYNRKEVFVWDKYSLDPNIPDSWTGIDILPSFAYIPVPDTKKIPTKNGFLPDPVTGKPLSISRPGGSEEVSFSDAVKGLSESGMKGLGLIANAIKSNNCNITKAFTFTFTR